MKVPQWSVRSTCISCREHRQEELRCSTGSYVHVIQVPQCLVWSWSCRDLVGLPDFWFLFDITTMVVVDVPWLATTSISFHISKSHYFCCRYKNGLMFVTQLQFLQFFVHWWAPLWELWCQQSSFSVLGVECCLYWSSGIFNMAGDWLISFLMGAALTIPKSVQIRLHAWCNDKLLSSGHGNVMLVCDMFSRLHMFPVSFSFVYFHVSQLFCIVHW